MKIRIINKLSFQTWFSMDISSPTMTVEEVKEVFLNRYFIFEEINETPNADSSKVLPHLDQNIRSN